MTREEAVKLRSGGGQLARDCAQVAAVPEDDREQPVALGGDPEARRDCGLADSRGQVLDADLGARDGQGGAEALLELADVERPLVGEHGPRRHARQLAPR